MPSVWIEKRNNRLGKSYVVRWEWSAGGERRVGSEAGGPFKAFAEKFAERKREELMAGKLGLEFSRSDATWAEFSRAYLDHCEKHKAPRTVRNFDARAMALAGERFGARQPASITGADVAAWETDLLARFNPTTARMWLRCLRTALRWGKGHGFVRDVPQFQMPRVEPAGRALSNAEVHDLLQAVSDRAWPAVVFALHTGVRRGELLSLAWNRVRRAQDGHWEAEIGGVGGPATKTGKSRIVPLHAAAVEAMGPPRSAGRVFPDVNEDLSHRVEEAARKAGLGRVRFHDLRHTWATRYMQATGDLFGLMALGGWSSMGSVRVYQHMTKARHFSAMAVDFHHIPTPEKTVDRR